MQQSGKTKDKLLRFTFDTACLLSRIFEEIAELLVIKFVIYLQFIHRLRGYDF